MGKQSNRRKSKGFHQTATSITMDDMTISREAGVTMKQAALAAGVMAALMINDVQTAKQVSIEVEQSGASIFEFEFRLPAFGGRKKRRLVEVAWQSGEEQAMLWISQKALDDGAWQTTELLRMLPSFLEMSADDLPTHQLAAKTIRLSADKLTKEMITGLISAGIVNFDGIERFWDHVPPKTRVIFQECFASHLSQIEKAQLVAATATRAASVNSTRSTSNRL
jgi:hypothetical protein